MKKRVTWIVMLLLAILMCASLRLAWQERQSLENGIWIHVIDVGQGDCMVIQTAQGNVLIDTGPDSSEAVVRAYLKSRGMDRFSYVILSHPHDDHIGNADMILREFQVDRLICTDSQSSAQAWKDVSEALNEAQGKLATEWIKPLEEDVYWLGKLRIEVIHAPEEDNAGGNEDSLILRMDYGENSLLVTGDAEHKTEEHLLQTVVSERLSVDLLKVAHHGSSGSSSQAFLQATDPAIAVISAGEGNSFGHPHAEVLQLLRKRNCQIYQTNINGTLMFYCDGNTISYRAPMGY